MQEVPEAMRRGSEAAVHADFDEPSRAISYLAEGLKAKFPDAQVEVIFCDPVNRRSRTSECFIRDLAVELGRLCRTFPGASVEYTPDHPYGMVGAIYSAEHRFFNPSHHSHSRPEAYKVKQDGRYVCVFLRRVRNEEVLIGSRSVVPKNVGVRIVS